MHLIEWEAAKSILQFLKNNHINKFFSAYLVKLVLIKEGNVSSCEFFHIWWKEKINSYLWEYDNI